MSVVFGEGTRPMGISDDRILEVVLQAMRATNQARDEASQLLVSATRRSSGPTARSTRSAWSALLLDVEEGLQAIGCDVVLSDERAVSQKRSPFRTVQSLVAYISTLAGNEQMAPRHVLITGTSRGIGESLAEHYLAAGDHVIGCGRSRFVAVASELHALRRRRHRRRRGRSACSAI